MPCRPQMGQKMVWPTQRHTIQRFGSLYSVEIGMHWKLTTCATGFLQINAVLSQSQTRAVTSALLAPYGPGNGVAHPKTYHTACWQPVLSGARPELETKHPYNRNSAKLLQITAALPQSQTRVVTSALSAPDGAGNGVAHPKTYHTACWQPVLG